MALDWDRLRIFHKVAKAGSITRAAEYLNLSQSATSRQIAALEEEAKVPLFHRHARGLILTEQGEILYQTACDVVDKIESATDRLTDFRGTPKGALKVTTTVGLGSAWLAVRLGKFIDLYPDIQIELFLSNHEIDLGMREADCALRLQRPQQSDIIQRKLFTVHFHVFASPKYIERFGKPSGIEDLDNHRIIVWGGETPRYLEDVNWLLHAGMAAGKAREPVMKINSILAIKRAVHQGAGIALLPDYSIAKESDLVPVLTDSNMPSFDTYFAYCAELKNSARLHAFRDFLLEQSRNWSF